MTLDEAYELCDIAIARLKAAGFRADRDGSHWEFSELEKITQILGPKDLSIQEYDGEIRLSIEVVK